MRASYRDLTVGLDQLLFRQLIEDELVQDRGDTIERFLQMNGWTWDEVLDQMLKE